MQRRAIVHIGPRKTATSTIQDGLSENRAILETAGVLYPGTRPNHSNVMAALVLDNPGDSYRARVRTEDPEDALFSKVKLKPFEREIETKDWHTLIISTEFLSDLDRDEIGRLKRWLDRYVDTVRIVYAVRDPIDWAVSVAQQMCKNMSDVDQVLNTPKHANWRRTIERYEAGFGREAMDTTLLAFEEMVADPDGPTGAFLKAMGLAELVPSLTQGPAHRNASLSWEAAMMIMALNARRPFFVDGERNPARSGRELSSFVGIGGQKFDLSDAARRRAFEASRGDVAWLRERYGIDRYDYPIEALRPSTAPSGYSPDFMIALGDRLADITNELNVTRSLLRIERLRARGKDDEAERVRRAAQAKFPFDRRLGEPRGGRDT